MPRSRRWLHLLAVSLCVTGGGLAEAAALGAGSPPGAPVATAATNRRARVFFSGHSLLDNPLPDWVEAIAKSRGESMGWQEQIVLGSPIRVRTKGNDPDASGFSGYRLGKSKGGGKSDVLNELARPTQLAPGEKYERLVITERTDLLGAIQWEGTIPNLRHFHDRVVEQNPSAGSSLAEVWPEIDKQDANAWLAYVKGELFVWECVAARVNDALSADKRTDRVEVIPAGLALVELVQRALGGGVPGVAGTPRQRLDAIFADDVHLTPLGIYLLASLHYAALFGTSPVGAAGVPGVDPAAVPLLQQIAWDTLSGYRLRAARAPTLAECTTRVASELCPAYHLFRGKPENVIRCKGWKAADGPFASVDSAPSERPAFVRWGAGLAALLLVGVAYHWQRSSCRKSRT